MRKILAVLVMAGVLAAGFGFEQQKGQQEVALQAAIRMETVEGNLKGAIEAYRKIAGGSDRAVAARALIRMGQCYERLGNSEARNAYGRVLREFGDQVQQAEEARVRLAALGAVGGDGRQSASAPLNTGLTLKKIDFPGQGLTNFARLSPDGSRILYTLRKDKKDAADSLYVMDFSSRQERRLAEIIGSGIGVQYFEWSPDATLVVYKYGQSELRLIGADGGQPRTLWSCSERKCDVLPTDWSRDGRHILCVIANEADRTVQIGILPAHGGEPRVVVSGPVAEFPSYTIRPRTPTPALRFSPDAKSILGERTVNGNSDLYIWAIDSGQESRLTDHPANDEAPFWSPDGRYVVFMSNREKTNDLWALPMQGARPAGDPLLIRRDLGKNTSLASFTAGGVLTLFEIDTGIADDLFTVPVDPTTGAAKGRLVPFAKYPTAHSLFPVWSPDGTRLAYSSRKGEARAATLWVSSGKERDDVEVLTPKYVTNGVAWSPDGHGLIFPGWDPEQRLGIFRVSLKDAAIETLQIGGKGTIGAFINVKWLPGAGVLRFEKLQKAGATREIYDLDLSSRTARLVTDRIPTTYYTWPSPNGKYLVYQEERALKLWSLETNAFLVALAAFPEGIPVDGPAWSPEGNRVAWKDGNQLKILVLPDTTPRILLEVLPASAIGGTAWTGGLAWSADGRNVAYVLQDNAVADRPRSELWTVPAAGGKSQKIADAPERYPRLGEVIWHSSGTMILVRGKAERPKGGPFQHWAMENFLPGMHIR